MVAKVVGKVKGSHPVFDTPVRVTPDTTVGEAMSLLRKRAHGAVVVVEDGRPLGTVSEADAAGVDRFAQVHEVMSTDCWSSAPTSRRRRSSTRSAPATSRSPWSSTATGCSAC